MANDDKKAKIPRIRKTAPTVRERVEAATAEAAAPKRGKTRAIASKLKFPFLRLHLPNNKAFNSLRGVLRPIGRALGWLVPRYFVNSWREVRQVIWPSRRETWRLTLAVFIFALVFGALVAGVDKGLDVAFKKLVLK